MRETAPVELAGGWTAPPSYLQDAAVRTILDASPTSVVGVGPDGTICYANPLTLATFGYRPDELVGRPLDVLVPDRLVERHRRHHEDFLREPHSRPMGAGPELVARHRDGTELPVEIVLIPIETGHGTCVIAVVHDVRERRAAERRVADLARAHLTLARMNQAIVRATDAQELYAETCRVAVEQGGYLGAWVSRSAPGRRAETLATAGRLDDYVAGLRITTDPEDPRGQGPAALALREGRAHYSADFLADSRTSPWHELASQHGIRASATVPLRCQGRVVAALTLWADEPHVFDEQMRALLEGMAENVSFALERFDAEEQLARVAAQRSDLLGRLVAAQEEERARIAADVHDDSVQALAAVDLRLGLLHRRVAEAAPELEAPVAQLQETVSAVVAGLRQLLFELEPAAEGTTLVEELREAAEHVLEGSGVRCRVEMASEAWPPQPPYDATRDPAWLPHEVRAQALRVAKEAFVNVRKHARATSVWVTVRPDPDGVEITVADDGVGVDPANLRSAPGHRGLATMRDRAEVAGGWCRIAGGPQGTHLTFWMPRNRAT